MGCALQPYYFLRRWKGAVIRIVWKGSKASSHWTWEIEEHRGHHFEKALAFPSKSLRRLLMYCWTETAQTQKLSGVVSSLLVATSNFYSVYDRCAGPAVWVMRFELSAYRFVLCRSFSLRLQYSALLRTLETHSTDMLVFSGKAIQEITWYIPWLLGRSEIHRPVRPSSGTVGFPRSPEPLHLRSRNSPPLSDLKSQKSRYRWHAIVRCTCWHTVFPVTRSNLDLSFQVRKTNGD